MDVGTPLAQPLIGPVSDAARAGVVISSPAATTAGTTARTREQSQGLRVGAEVRGMGFVSGGARSRGVCGSIDAAPPQRSGTGRVEASPNRRGATTKAQGAEPIVTSST